MVLFFLVRELLTFMRRLAFHVVGLLTILAIFEDEIAVLLHPSHLRRRSFTDLVFFMNRTHMVTANSSCHFAKASAFEHKHGATVSGGTCAMKTFQRTLLFVSSAAVN